MPVQAHCFHGYWINNNPPGCNWLSGAHPAPFLRREFSCPDSIADAKLYICGLGYCEVWLNGRKVSENVLQPVVTQYDRRVHYLVYDLKDSLRPGNNVLGVILGTGWYNHHTSTGWQFSHAPWRDNPKMLCDLFINGECLIQSDTSWKTNTGPLIFDSLRKGETYDARLEIPGWNEVNFADSNWQNAVRVPPPPGELVPQEVEPIAVFDQYAVIASKTFPDGVVYDFPLNIAGWCVLKVRGEAGTQVNLTYGEMKTPDGDLDITNISNRNYSTRHHLDTYILKGDGVETWEPRFTYHGFQFVKIQIEGKAEVISLEARFVHSQFQDAGQFSSSDRILNRLQQLTRISYLSNYVGIPTDCPHREKNGWTGDAMLAAETGLWNFQAASGYRHFTRLLADTQRFSGQLPGIAPSPGWGYNWGNGPAWDSLLILVPWYVHLYTGDDRIIRENYSEMKRYMEYCQGMADDHLLYFGLGDWCHHDTARTAPVGITSSGYYHINAVTMAKFASLLGFQQDQQDFLTLAETIRQSFRKTFYHGDGLYGNGEWTSLACPVYQGLASPDEAKAAVQRLVKAVRENEHRADFGILGAKYVPRVLSKHGYAEDAFRLITQQEYPGWGNWVKQGAASLWETWNGNASRNHIMFGDISAWMFEYLGGISPQENAPGFKHFSVQPHPVPALQQIQMYHECSYGRIQSSWQQKDGQFNLQLSIPSGSGADLTLPNGDQHTLTASNYEFHCPLP
ncbi:MAG: family 78 glycoside hydrolase catalytic domain [Lentisphaeria bacterium]